MFSSLKKSLGFTPIKETFIGHYKYGSQFKIEQGKTLRIIRCELSPTTLKVKEYANREEMEIYYHKTNVKSSYPFSKPPYIKPNGDMFFELYDRMGNAFFNVTIEPNGQAADMRIQGREEEGYMFSLIEMLDYNTNESLEKLEEIIQSHLALFVKERNGFTPLGLPSKTVINVWSAFAQKEIVNLPEVKQYSKYQILKRIDEIRELAIELLE